ncbi:MAG: FtsW/RodA/SpoVE family cell cycle protein [Campylobacter sp.]|nr:FtsW/RodA/SpoVE family cell cycle protein [Campylobacter sp.]
MSADKTLYYLAVALLCIGVIFSLSLSVFTVLYFEYSELHFFIRQFLVSVLGIILMWSISRLNPDKHFKILGFTILIICIIMLIAMYVLPSSMVTEAGGARRWIRLPGFSLSPVEFLKIGFIFFLAWSFERKIISGEKRIKDEFKTLIPYVILLVILAFVIAFLQKDFGQMVVLMLTFIIMAVFAGSSFKIFMATFVIAIFGVFIMIVSSQHRITRIKSWWGTIQDMVLSILPKSWEPYLRIEDVPEPYQISHSLNAIKHGGFFGQDLGGGTIKLGFLSEVHTDFVLSGIFEEIGLIGIFFIILLFWFLLYRIFRISSRSENKVYHLFTLGIGLMMTFSFLINAYGISSITPVKGLAVPFLSYGGSSILATCIGVGMVLMISKKAK